VAITSCKNQPVSFPVPLTMEPSLLRCPTVTWVRLPKFLVSNLKLSVCPRRRTLFLGLFPIWYSWDFLSSPSSTIHAFCVVPACCLSLVRKVSSKAVKTKRKDEYRELLFETEFRIRHAGQREQSSKWPSWCQFSWKQVCNKKLRQICWLRLKVQLHNKN